MLSLDPHCAETSVEWALISGPEVISAIMTMCFVIKGLWLQVAANVEKKPQPFYLNDIKLWSGFDLCNGNVIMKDKRNAKTH